MNEDRFSWNAGDVGLVTDEGQILTASEMSEYLKKQREELLTIKEKVEIGDVVRLKVTNRIVTIVQHNAEESTYRGAYDGRIFLFGQEDIEEIIRRK